MQSFKFFVSVCAILVLIFAVDNEVTAAPHPCLWMLDYDHTRRQVTTTPTPTTVKPELVEEFSKLKQMTPNQLQKFFNDWMMATGSEKPKYRSRSPVEKMVSSYVKFLANVFNMF